MQDDGLSPFENQSNVDKAGKLNTDHSHESKAPLLHSRTIRADSKLKGSGHPSPNVSQSISPREYQPPVTVPPSFQFIKDKNSFREQITIETKRTKPNLNVP
jgi:hypothetical protein